MDPKLDRIEEVTQPDEGCVFEHRAIIRLKEISNTYNTVQSFVRMYRRGVRRMSQEREKNAAALDCVVW